jgi:hypothetical protein
MKTYGSLEVLERDDLLKVCPSFYATHPKLGVSDRYAFLNTEQISDQLFESGWVPVYAGESRAIDASNRGFTRHVVRWAHNDYRVNGERIELVGVNSHNRAAAFTFMAGIFRLVCSNGLIAQTSDFGSFKIKHIGNIGDQVSEAIEQLASVAGTLSGKISQFKEIELSPVEQDAFATGAIGYVYDEPETAPIRIDDLLKPRRFVDTKTGSRFDYRPKGDLWTTYNVVQENLIKGGIRGRNAEGKRMKTRQIKAIDKDVKLNRALWIMAETMAEAVKKSA